MRWQLIIGEALSGLRRNASMVVSVVLVTFVSLTFVGTAMLLQMQIATTQSFWAERAQVEVYMCSSISIEATCSQGAATEEQIDEVTGQLESEALAPLIRDYTFLSSDEAYQELVEQFGDDLTGAVSADQWPATFRINLVDSDQSDVLVEAFNGAEGIEEVRDQLQYLDPLFAALTIATYIAVGIAGLMLVAAALLIATTIRLSAYARRRELGIMRLVGASNRFIQTPFILEGVFAALIGSALAGVAVWAGLRFGVDGYLSTQLSIGTTWVGTSDLWLVIPVIVSIGVVLSALSAAFAIRRWLRA